MSILNISDFLVSKIHYNYAFINVNDSFIHYTVLIIFVIILIFIIIKIFNLRLNVVENRKSKLEKIIERRTKQLQIEKEKVDKLLQESIFQQKELKNVNEIKTKLIHTAAHDLKNPLQAILGFQFILNDRKDLDEELNEILNAIFRSSRKMFNIINDLLENASYDYNELYLNKKFYPLSEIIYDVISENNIRALQKKQKIEAKLDNKIIVEVDKKWFACAIDNILNNAIKYSDFNKKIEIRTYHEDNYINLEIVDEGIGIEKEEIKFLFDKFYKTSGSPTDGETSTGYGLFIAKDIINKHYGEIVVESQLKKGTTFIIRLPKN